MATIGVINVVAKATFDPLSAGLKKAGDVVKSFAGGVAGVTPQLATFSRLDAVVSGVSHSLIEMTRSAMESVDKTGDLAQRIGTSAEKFTALAHAVKLTGSEVEGMEVALLKMNANLGDAANTGAGPAADALKKLGLNAADLIKMDPADAFIKIGDAIAKLPTRAQQAAATVDIFGKSGQSLINTLTAGGDEIRRLTGDAQQLGLVFSQVDAAQVGAANDAIDRMSGALHGVVNQFAIQLSPFIEEAAKRLVNFATSGSTGGERVAGVIKYLAKGFGLVSDVIHTIGVYWHAAQSLITSGISTLVKSFGSLWQIIDKGLEAIGAPTSGVGEFTKTWGEDLDRLSNEQWETFQKKLAEAPPSEKIDAWFKSIKDKARAAAQDAANSAKKIPGAIEPAVDKALKSKADSLKEKLRTPLQEFKAEIAEQQKLAKAGLLNPEELRAANVKSFQELQDKLKANEGPKFAGAQAAGSAEARSSILQFRGLMNERDVSRDILQTNRAQLVEQQKQGQRFDQFISSIRGDLAGEGAGAATGETLSAIL